MLDILVGIPLILGCICVCLAGFILEGVKKNLDKNPALKDFMARAFVLGACAFIFCKILDCKVDVGETFVAGYSMISSAWNGTAMDANSVAVHAREICTILLQILMRLQEILVLNFAILFRIAQLLCSVLFLAVSSIWAVLAPICAVVYVFVYLLAVSLITGTGIFVVVGSYMAVFYL